MSEYREIRGSLQGERCEHKSWADLCEKCEIDRLSAENENLVKGAVEQAAACGRLLRDLHAVQAENERLRAALIPFACRCARKGEGAGGTCLAPGGICSSWNARAALEEKR